MIRVNSLVVSRTIIVSNKKNENKNVPAGKSLQDRRVHETTQDFRGPAPPAAPYDGVTTRRFSRRVLNVEATTIEPLQRRARRTGSTSDGPPKKITWKQKKTKIWKNHGPNAEQSSTDPLWTFGDHRNLTFSTLLWKSKKTYGNKSKSSSGRGSNGVENPVEFATAEWKALFPDSSRTTVFCMRLASSGPRHCLFFLLFHPPKSAAHATFCKRVRSMLPTIPFQQDRGKKKEEKTRFFINITDVHNA